MNSAIYLGVLVTFSCIIIYQKLRRFPPLDDSLEVRNELYQEESMFFKLIKAQYRDVIDDTNLNFTKLNEDMIFPDKEKYLIYFPYEGLGNQRMCLLRALYTARQLNRTLLIPPLMASLHNKINYLWIDWRQMFDFSQFLVDETVKTSFKFISHRMIRNVRKLLESKGSECFTHGKYKEFKDLSYVSRQFLFQFGLSWRGKYEWHNITGVQSEKASYMINYFEKKRDVPMICATNFQYVSFGTQMSEYWNKLLPSKNIVLAAWNFMSAHGITNEKYAAIHWRRGDFEWYCRYKEFPNCWPSLEDLKAKILKINREQGIELILVGTNERSFELDMSNYGIDVLRIDLPHLDQGEPTQWRELAPVALDEFLFEHSDYFVGNKFSSLSYSVVRRRHKAGLQNITETF